MALQFIRPDDPSLSDTEEQQVLVEQTPGYYPEFAAFLQGELQGAGGRLLFRAPSGKVYSVRQTEENSEDLEGIRISLLVPEKTDSQTLNEAIDEDIWSFLEWLVEKVGGEWTREALLKTGAIYKVPGVPKRI